MIDSVAITELLGEPADVVRAKLADRLTSATRRFVERSPFVLLATASADGRCDVSPRGDPDGFVGILDERVSKNFGERKVERWRARSLE